MGKQQEKSNFTLAMWMEFLSKKQEHYPISDAFVKKYQQSPDNTNGYVYYAWKTNHTICQELAEPNQKWHFFESYILRELVKNSTILAVEAKNKICLDTPAIIVYNRIKCPELLLWIAEATGIPQCVICAVAEVAKNIIDGPEKRARNKAGETIRKMIIWKTLETEMIKQIQEKQNREDEKQKKREENKKKQEELKNKEQPS